MGLITDDNRKWWILAVMGRVLGMCVLDETVVGAGLGPGADDRHRAGGGDRGHHRPADGAPGAPPCPAAN